MLQFQTFPELLQAARSLYKEESTFEQWQAFKEYLINNEEAAKAVIDKETINSLNQLTFKDKKAKMVSSVYSSLTQFLTFGNSVQWSPMQETFKDAVLRIVNAYTPEQFQAYKDKRKAEREAKEAAINNPQTLDEFRTFIQYKGEKALTQEQRERHDELQADQRRRIQERSQQTAATVQKVENVNADMEIKESFHAKKQIPLWVVTLSDRVSREKYLELNEKAKKLGGYYSSYKGNGAIPGFTFEKQEAAQLFAGLKDQNANAAELKKEEQENKQQTRAEALREKGEKMISDGNEELNRDRKDNTHRRATMAAHAEERAAAKVKFGQTLQKIADMIEAGEVKYLDKITAVKDLEELQSCLNAAKYKHIQATGQRSDNYEISSETANFARIPYPLIHSGHKTELLKMQEVNGKKLAAARMLKRLGNGEEYEVKHPAALEDFETLFLRRCSVLDQWRVDSFKERYMQHKRILRIGIETPEQLRAALRELLRIKQGAAINKEQEQKLKNKEIERQFLGRKIPGFFPTPEDAAAEIVKNLQIKEGETICEPSAGLGHIAEQVREQHPHNTLQCIEIVPSLAEALKVKGFNVLNDDFLQHSEKYDVIVMNPPFENLQDVAHVQHAFTLLKPGGRLAAIMANNKHRAPEFMQMVEQYGYFENNPDGMFLTAFNSTGVNTITVYMEKPADQNTYKTNQAQELQELAKIGGFNPDTQKFEYLPQQTTAPELVQAAIF